MDPSPAKTVKLEAPSRPTRVGWKERLLAVAGTVLFLVVAVNVLDAVDEKLPRKLADALGVGIVFGFIGGIYQSLRWGAR